MKKYLIETNRGNEEFYTIDELYCCGVNYLLLESCVNGEEVPYIVIREHDEHIVEWNWIGTLEEWLDS